MTVRLIASAVIAALLLIGFTPSAPQTSEPAITATQAPAAEVPNDAKAAPAQAATISAEEAEKIALAHAGLTDAVALRSRFDRDDRVPHWDVEFRSGDWEYDYEIAQDGTVLEWDKEYDPAETLPPATEPAKPQRITAQEAKAIALAHAGLTENQVRGLRAELDLDDGVAEYEVEFTAGGYEYDYEIDTASGKIRFWDKELDD